MKNVYSIVKLILMQKKDSRMVHDDMREEYLQSLENANANFTFDIQDEEILNITCD